VSQQLLIHGSIGTLSPQEIQALASTLQQQQQSLQQQLQQFAMFQQANPTTSGQLPTQTQFFLQNQVDFSKDVFSVSSIANSNSEKNL
jgi:class 2 POU domain transcription factor